MTDAAAIMAAKAALRAQAKAARAALPATWRQAASLAIAAAGLDFLPTKPKPGAIVGGFMPIGEEISPLPLMARLHAAGCQLALPVMMGKGKPLQFRAYVPGDRLVPAVWGIREPAPDQPVLFPDIVLTALLAFDDRGYRLGYGGGFYDRTLAELQQQLDNFRAHYNEQRPHRALDRATPGHAYRQTPKAAPATNDHAQGHYRIRYDRLDNGGAMSFRRAGRMHHLGIGKAHARKRVLAIADDTTVTVTDLATAEVLSTHLIQPDKNYWRNQNRPAGRWPTSQT